jgi:hypothetical protein
MCMHSNSPGRAGQARAGVGLGDAVTRHMNLPTSAPRQANSSTCAEAISGVDTHSTSSN